MTTDPVAQEGGPVAFTGPDSRHDGDRLARPASAAAEDALARIQCMRPHDPLPDGDAARLISEVRAAAEAEGGEAAPPLGD